MNIKTALIVAVTGIIVTAPALAATHGPRAQFAAPQAAVASPAKPGTIVHVAGPRMTLVVKETSEATQVIALDTAECVSHRAGPRQTLCLRLASVDRSI